MVDLILKTCKNCDTTFNPEAEVIRIKALEVVNLIPMKVATCPFCPPSNHRTGIKPGGLSYDDWDADSWKRKL